MKILIVSTNDIYGGAAKAAYRLHCALQENGIESQMLVMNKTGDDSTVAAVEDGSWQKVVAKIRFKLDQFIASLYKNRRDVPFSPAFFGSGAVVRKIHEIDPDIVHLHWICGGMIKVEDLKKIKKPIVWSLHDDWPFSGGCHIKWECENYKKECGVCPVLNSKREYDLSRLVLKRKENTFKKIENLTVIGLSRWIFNCSKESSLLKNRPHINLPNPINTNIFRPIDKRFAKNLWDFPVNKKMVLFGAIKGSKDLNKGFNELANALNVVGYENIELVVFGSSEPQNPPKFRFKTHYVGRLSDDVSLVSLYNACDVTVVPSLQENLSNTVMESLSCGTPVVAFDVGGNKDMIDHLCNGYLAKPFDYVDLAGGIEWVLRHGKYDDLTVAGRQKVLKNFDRKIVAKKYIELYSSILEKR